MVGIPPIAAIVIDLLQTVPPADRADLLREQVRAIEEAANEKRRSLALHTFAAIAIAANELGIELPMEITSAASTLAPDAAERIENELAEMVENLPALHDALAALDAGCP
jgi:hypothetical protein